MKIQLLFFGILTDITGCDRVILKDILNTDELISKIEIDFPGLKEMTYRIAVNKMIINGNMLLKDGDEIALLPPFSGG